MRSQNRYDKISTKLQKTSREFAWTLTLATYSISGVEFELNYGTVRLPHLPSPWRERNTEYKNNGYVVFKSNIHGSAE